MLATRIYQNLLIVLFKKSETESHYRNGVGWKGKLRRVIGKVGLFQIDGHGWIRLSLNGYCLHN